MAGCDIILYTATGKPANVNNSGGNRTFITYRRASQKMAHSSLAVTEICVIIASKVLQYLYSTCYSLTVLFCEELLRSKIILYHVKNVQYRKKSKLIYSVQIYCAL